MIEVQQEKLKPFIDGKRNNKYFNEYMKKYNKATPYILCAECGAKYKKANKWRHERSKKHTERKEPLIKVKDLMASIEKVDQLLEIAKKLASVDRIVL